MNDNLKTNTNILSAMCRLCMAKNVTLTNMFRGETKNIAEDLYYCTGLQVSQADGLPNNVCTDCLIKLTTSVKFKNKCLKTDKQLKKIKMEHIKDDYLIKNDDYLIKNDDIGHYDEFSKGINQKKDMDNIKNGEFDKVKDTFENDELKIELDFESREVEDDDFNDIVTYDCGDEFEPKDEYVEDKLGINNDFSTDATKTKTESQKTISKTHKSHKIKNKNKNSDPTSNIADTINTKTKANKRRKKNLDISEEVIIKICPLDPSSYINDTTTHSLNSITINNNNSCSNTSNSNITLNSTSNTFHTTKKAFDTTSNTPDTTTDTSDTNSNTLNCSINNLGTTVNTFVTTTNTFDTTTNISDTTINNYDTTTNYFDTSSINCDTTANNVDTTKYSQNSVIFNCDLCNIKFNNKKMLRKHNREKHSNLSAICEICGKYFSKPYDRSSHMLRHLPPRFRCALCDYAASSKHDLAMHLRVHTGEKAYQCEFCTKSYRTSSHLKRHWSVAHSPGDPRRFRCARCDARFTSKPKLMRHADTHDNIKRYACEVCKAAFTRLTVKRSHMLKQHNIKVPMVRPGRKPAYMRDYSLERTDINK